MARFTDFVEAMAPKYHPCRSRAAIERLRKNELSKAMVMTSILADRSAEARRRGEALISEADNLSSQSWNERMWSVGEPIDPSPTIEQAINGGYGWLEIECSLCKTPNDIDLAALLRPPRQRVCTISRTVALLEMR